MEGRKSAAPRRYGLGADGEPQRVFIGKPAEEFSDKDALLFSIDTDLKLHGRVMEDTLDAVRQSGYSYKNGQLAPLAEAGRETPLPDLSVRVYPQKDMDKLLAFASVTIGGCFAVNGVRIYDTEKGPYVAMPSSKDAKGGYHDICCPTTKEMRKALNAAVLGEYQRAAEQTSLRGELQDAAKQAASRPAKAASRPDKGER